MFYVLGYFVVGFFLVFLMSGNDLFRSSSPFKVFKILLPGDYKYVKSKDIT